LHFEKPKTTYTGDTIITLAKERFQSMNIELGNPAMDGKQMLCRLRVFALELDGCPTVAKVAKGHDNPALQGELSVKIKGETLASKDACELLIKIIKDSFRRGHEFEITQLNKGINEGENSKISHQH
jgi:hypothetical protein